MVIGSLFALWPRYSQRMMFSTGRGDPFGVSLRKGYKTVM
jgi:hypothetical protein